MAKLKGGTRIYGDIKIDGAIYDSSNQVGVGGSVLISTGVGIAWTTSSSSGSGSWTRKTANYTAVASDKIIADTTAGPFTVTLPASPVAGNSIVIADGGDWKTFNLTVARNGNKIEGGTEDFILDIKGIIVEFVYEDATDGWQVYAYTGSGGSGSIDILEVMLFA